MSVVFEIMCDEECGEDQIRIEEQIFLHHIEQLKRETNKDIGRIAGVLLEAHVVIREKFQSLQVRLYQDLGTIPCSFDRNIFL